MLKIGVIAACLLCVNAAHSACITSDIAGVWNAYGKGNRTTAKCRLVVAANGTVNATKSKCTVQRIQRRAQFSDTDTLSTVTLKVTGSITSENAAGCLFSASIKTLGPSPYIGSGQFTMSSDRQSLVGSGVGTVTPRSPKLFTFEAVKN